MATLMNEPKPASVAFDPHHLWLGIPPTEQPADHYRLLGLRRFEPDVQQIEMAADRLMGFVRGFQNGLRAAESQKVLNELAAARACLLNPARRAEYDAWLSGGAVANVAATPVKARRKVARKASPVAETIKMVVGGGVGLFGAVLLLSYFWGIDLLGWQHRAQSGGEGEKVAAAAPVAPKPAPPRQSRVIERPARPAESRPEPKPETQSPVAAVLRQPESKPEPDVGSEVKPVADPNNVGDVADLLPVGSVWEGTGTHRKGAGVGDESRVVVEITSRDGKAFRGTFQWTNVRSNNTGKFDIEGQVEGGRITWMGTVGKITAERITADWDDGASQGDEVLIRTR